MSVGTLEIRLFGSMQVSLGGEPMPRARNRSVEWLLALLILRAGQPVSRSWLAGTLWPESSEAQALLNLRISLMRLRDALGEEAARILAPDRRVLSLDLTGAFADVAAFDAAIRGGDEESLRTAVALYTGPLLEGCYEEWALSERNLRTEQYLAALETLAEQAEAREEHQEAIRHLRRAEALDPLRDSLARRLMACFAATSDPAAAIEVYRNFRIRLQEELASAPDEATTRLFHDIRAASRTAARDERPSVAAADAAPRPQRAPIAPVPRPLTPLIGREQAVSEIQRLLQQNRLVTLLGGGGVGKTRLAMEVAASTEEEFAGGVVWVELAPLADGALILRSIAAALGLNDAHAEDGSELESRIVSRLSAGASLLALDNCEHLRDASAQAAHTLLSRCPGLRVLATSRQRLGIPGEVVWHTPSLAAPSPDSSDIVGLTPEALIRAYPSLQLLAERVVQVRPGFQLATQEEVAAAAHICWRLDGIPLALELAAARAQALSLPQIASRLDDRFRLLTGGSRAALPRQRTLRALIDWSYDQLSPAEQTLLRRLSVFVGGWRLEAVEAVFDREGMDEVFDVMVSLVDKSLALAEEQAQGLRYRMLETVREYGREKLQQSGEEEEARARHAAYYLALAEQARPFLDKPEPGWLDRLESEHDNLRGALTYYNGQEATLDKAVRLAAALEVFWSLRGHMYERRAWLVNLSHRQTPPTEARARLLMVTGWLLNSADGNPTLGKQYFAESLAIMRQLDDKRGIAAALSGLAVLESDADVSCAFAEESLALMREVGDREGMANSLYHRGLIARQLGDPDLARACWMECSALYEAMGWKGELVLCRLGDLAAANGDYTAARRFFARFVTEREEIGDRWSVAWGLKGLGALALAEGRMAQAAAILGASFTLKESIGKRLSDMEREPYATMRNALREALGESVVAAEWEAGCAMTYDEAVRFALSEGSA